MTTEAALRPWPDCELVLPANATRAEWLRGRSIGLGGSDLVILMGHGYVSGRTERQLWQEKSGQVESEEAGGTIRMRRGQHMEAFIAREFQLQSLRWGGELIPVPVGLVRSVEHPCMVASADAKVVGDGATEPYEGVEYKHLDNYQTAKVVREIQQVRDYPRFYWQMVHYLAVTGAPGWWLAVDSPYYDELVVKYLDRDDCAEDVLRAIAKCESWWNQHIELGFEVDPAASLEAETAALLEDAVEVDAPWEAEEKLERLRELQYPGTKEGKAEKAEILRWFEDRIGAHKTLTMGGAPIVRWQVSAGRGSFDREGLRAENPELHDRFWIPGTGGAKSLRLVRE